MRPGPVQGFRGRVWGLLQESSSQQGDEGALLLGPAGLALPSPALLSLHSGALVSRLPALDGPGPGPGQLCPPSEHRGRIWHAPSTAVRLQAAASKDSSPCQPGLTAPGSATLGPSTVCLGLRMGECVMGGTDTDLARLSTTSSLRSAQCSPGQFCTAISTQ